MGQRRDSHQRAGPPERKARVQVRGEQLVENVLDATFRELARVDYEDLSFERIARRAGVNKVTLYRRWPTKRELTLAALQRVANWMPTPVDTEDFHRDLLGFLRAMTGFLELPIMRVAVRVAYGSTDEMREMVDNLRAEKEAQVRRIFDQALTRKQLPATVDVDMALSLLLGTLFDGVVLQRKTFDDEGLRRLADAVLKGTLGSSVPQRVRSAHGKKDAAD